MKADRRTPHLPYAATANYKLKSNNSLRINTLPRPLIRAGKIVVYDNTVQSQITCSVTKGRLMGISERIALVKIVRQNQAKETLDARWPCSGW